MSHEPKPSEHAMQVAERLITHLFISHEARTSVITAYALEIDQHAIAPAVAERDRRIAELEAKMRNLAESWVHRHAMSLEPTHNLLGCSGELMQLAKSERSAP